eukprot:scaffold29924_cov19-Prasinocladus_malaysianus.AAC.1
MNEQGFALFLVLRYQHNDENRPPEPQCSTCEAKRIVIEPYIAVFTPDYILAQMTFASMEVKSMLPA